MDPDLNELNCSALAAVVSDLRRAHCLPLGVATQLGVLQLVPGADPLARQRVAEAERVEFEVGHWRDRAKKRRSASNDRRRELRSIAYAERGSEYDSYRPRSGTITG